MVVRQIGNVERVLGKIRQRHHEFTHVLSKLCTALCRVCVNQQTRARTNEKKATFASLGVSYSTGYGSGRRRVTQLIFLCFGF